MMDAVVFLPFCSFYSFETTCHLAHVTCTSTFMPPGELSNLPGASCQQQQEVKSAKQESQPRLIKTRQARQHSATAINAETFTPVNVRQKLGTVKKLVWSSQRRKATLQQLSVPGGLARSSSRHSRSKGGGRSWTSIFEQLEQLCPFAGGGGGSRHCPSSFLVLLCRARGSLFSRQFCQFLHQLFPFLSFLRSYLISDHCMPSATSFVSVMSAKLAPGSLFATGHEGICTLGVWPCT